MNHKLKTVNSLSGGQTSAYVAANFKADYNVFSLVRIEDKKAKFPDAKIRQEVEDRLQKPFIATAEDDVIIYTMLDLEQFIGRKIDWVSGLTFDDVVRTKGGWLPNKLHRYCTSEMKLKPIFDWWCDTSKLEPVEMRIGFRANEMSRAKKMIEKCNSDGVLEFKGIVGTTIKNRRNKWRNVPWQIPAFPLISSAIYKDDVISYWENKPVRFARLNNCVGCFHRNPILLKKMFEEHPAKMNWFTSQELGRNDRGTWKTGITYQKIKEHKLQMELSFDDFQECDSGNCGI